MGLQNSLRDSHVGVRLEHRLAHEPKALPETTLTRTRALEPAVASSESFSTGAPQPMYCRAFQIPTREALQLKDCRPRHSQSERGCAAMGKNLTRNGCRIVFNP